MIATAPSSVLWVCLVNKLNLWIMADAQPVQVAGLQISSQEWLKVSSFILVHSALAIEEGGEFRHYILTAGVWTRRRRPVNEKDFVVAWFPTTNRCGLSSAGIRIQ